MEDRKYRGLSLFKLVSLRGAIATKQSLKIASLPVVARNDTLLIPQKPITGALVRWRPGVLATGALVRWLLVLWCAGALVTGALVTSTFAAGENSIVTGHNEKISLDLRGIEIAELFKVLSLKTGLTIVPQANVKGRVNLFLNNVSFDDVLDIILVSNGLACEKKGDIYNIMTASQYYTLYGKQFEEKRKVKSFKLSYAKPADIFNALSQLKSDIGKLIVDESSATIVLVDIPEKLDLMEGMLKEIDQPPSSEVVSLKYAKAKDLEAQVSKMLTAGTGDIRVDERTNKIMVMDLPDKMKKIKRMVRAFDEEPSQVMIEAEIIELSLSSKFQRGVEWERLLNGVHGADFKGEFSLGLEDDRQEVNVGTLARSDYNTILQVLQTYGRTHILSQPRIAAVNKQEAKILVGSREAYITQTQSSGSTTTTTAESIQYVDVGVKLNVTPDISRDGFVTLKIRPEVSSVREFLSTKLGSRVPIVSTSEAETVVKVKDGAMVMIAGLTKKKDVEQRSEVPGVGRIPLLGLFFSKRISGPDEPKTTELVVFITPRIIRGDNLIATDDSLSDIVLKKQPKGFKE